MARATKPEVKLIDLFDAWWKAYQELKDSEKKMETTFRLRLIEEKTFDEFQKRLKKCKC